MKRTLLPFMLFSLILPLSSQSASSPDADIADRYFSNVNPVLTAQEKAALGIASRWSSGRSSSFRPSPGANGSVQFLYGVQQPSILCAVLQVCVVSLQPGERVNSIHLGDTARWTVEPAVTGAGENEIQQVIIKPMDVGLETSLVVTTDRHTYHLRLRSHRIKYMPQVSFVYPEDAMAKWDAIRQRKAQRHQERTLPQTGEYLDQLSFNYDVKGSAPWKPVRVYNDGVKTIIEMPDSMARTEAPSLLVLHDEGGLFKDEETVMVNYRVQGNRYLVDNVFDKAIMVAGVGRNQDRVTITRRQ